MVEFNCPWCGFDDSVEVTQSGSEHCCDHCGHTFVPCSTVKLKEGEEPTSTTTRRPHPAIAPAPRPQPALYPSPPVRSEVIRLIRHDLKRGVESATLEAALEKSGFESDVAAKAIARVEQSLKLWGYFGLGLLLSVVGGVVALCCWLPDQHAKMLGLYVALIAALIKLFSGQYRKDESDE